MPLPMVHLNIAKNIVELGFNDIDLSQFYLGIISPDAIHMRQNADRNDKNKTHLIPENKKWTEINEVDYYNFIFEYLELNKNNVDKSFLWGYLIHILTDMYWTCNVYTEFKQKYINDVSPIQDERMAYYNDTDILDQILYNECDWRKNIWLILEKSSCLDFLGLLTENEIKLWKERTLHWYDEGKSKHKNPIKYITKIDIQNFIISFSKIIHKRINNNV